SESSRHFIYQRDRLRAGWTLQGKIPPPVIGKRAWKNPAVWFSWLKSASFFLTTHAFTNAKLRGLSLAIAQNGSVTLETPAPGLLPLAQALTTSRFAKVPCGAPKRHVRVTFTSPKAPLPQP
ncbi:hypothetical protein KKF84_21555, partial [Myxococcota bacterium]|nr:hypothetical protein [Myxococcota bacterium]